MPSARAARARGLASRRRAAHYSLEHRVRHTGGSLTEIVSIAALVLAIWILTRSGAG
ncbi:MAG: hypothetical protein RRA92_06865 [Gemmatimonadota bacterium]|nr:hypothetical protein [Gemmatimonadota bacterium]